MSFQRLLALWFRVELLYADGTSGVWDNIFMPQAIRHNGIRAHKAKPKIASEDQSQEAHIPAWNFEIFSC
jgi:hypothetical protein